MGDKDQPEDTKPLKRTQEDREKEAAEDGENMEEGEVEEEEEDGPQFVDLNGGEEMGYLVEDDGEEGGDADDADDIADDGGDGEGGETGQEVPDMGEEEPVVEITDMAIAKFEGHSDSVLCVDVSHDGRLAASGGCDEVAYIWNIPDMKQLFKLSAKGGAAHTDSVSVCKFSSDDKLLATGGLDGCVCIWNVADGHLLKKLEGPDGDIQWLNWHPRGPVVVAGSVDSTVWLWNARSGDCLSVLSAHTEDVSCGLIIRGGTRLLTGSNDASVKLWDPKEAAPLYTIPTKEPVLSLAASDKDPIAVAGLADNSAYVFNVETGKIVARLLGHDDIIESVGFVSIGGIEHAVTGSADGDVRIWDQSGTVRTTCEHSNGVVRFVVSSPLIFVCYSDGISKIWDARTGTCVTTLTGHSDSVLDIAITPDAKHVITASDDHTCRIFEVPRS